MASTEQRSPGRYRAVWRDSDGKKQHSGSPYFTALSAAQAYAEQQEEASRRGVDTAASSMTWGQWRDTWLPTRTVTKASASTDDANIRAHITPRWGGVRLNQVTAYDCQIWVNELSATLAAGTVLRIWGTFNRSLNAAVGYRVLATAPCPPGSVHLPKPIERPPAILYPDEFRTVIDAMAEPYATFVAVLVSTGMRFGEVAGLHWQRVNLLHRELTVMETWSALGREVTACPKGRIGHRVVLPAWVAERLPEQTGRRTCGRPHHKDAEECRSSLVVPAPRGGPMDHKNMLNRHFKPALAKSGLSPVRQHDLRHTFASLLAQDGVGQDVIADLLGQSDMRSVRRYRHMGNAHLDAVRDKLEGWGGDSGDGPTRDARTG
jgi:integrase